MSNKAYTVTVDCQEIAVYTSLDRAKLRLIEEFLKIDKLPNEEKIKGIKSIIGLGEYSDWAWITELPFMG